MSRAWAKESCEGADAAGLAGHNRGRDDPKNALQTARGIPGSPISWTYAHEVGACALEMMACRSWGRAASRPHRTRGGPIDPSTCHAVRAGAIDGGPAARRWRGRRHQAAPVPRLLDGPGTKGRPGPVFDLHRAPIYSRPATQAPPRPPPHTWLRCTGPRPTLARVDVSNAPGRGRP